MSWAEAKWTVDSLLQNLGQAPNNMRLFTAYPVDETTIGLKFVEPLDSYSNGNLICAVGGVMIRMSNSRFPTSASDGSPVVNNTEIGKYASEPYLVEGLTKGVTYYFSAFPYSTQGVYNESSDAANRASAIPASGETINVTVSVDDPNGFTGAVITCVDETNELITQSAMITPSRLTASFSIPAGDAYHVEYSNVTGYAKPSNTESKVAVAGVITELAGDYLMIGVLPLSGGDMTGPLGLYAYSEKLTNLTGNVIDPTEGGVFYASVGADTTYSFGGSLEAGKAYSVVLVLAFGSTAYTVGLPDSVSWIGDAPTFEADKTYEVVLRTYNGGARWHASCGGGV